MPCSIQKKQLIEESYKVFSQFKRPKQFHDVHPHDPESGDHDSLLQKRKRKSLCLEDIACIGYNPITSINAEGMAYFMPRLIEFALNIEEISEKENEPYLWAFILQLMPDNSEKKFSLFKKDHVEHICKVLKYIQRNYIDFVIEDCFDEEFNLTLAYWNEINHKVKA